jgi:hypothetical protein
MPKKHLDHEDRKERHFRRLGTRNPVCVICGRRDPYHPEIFDLHHVAGKNHHDDVCIVCSNCHRTLTDRQKDHLPPAASPPIGMLATIGHYLLGLADMLAMIVEILRKFGNWLLGEASRTATT